MQTRIVAYAAVSVPLLLAAFVAGIIFERYRVQSASPDGIAGIWSELPGQTGTGSAAHERVPQSGKLSREQQIAAGMQAIQAAWRTAIDREDLFAVRHSASCYSARFIRHGAKLDAEMKEGVGAGKLFIRISGMTATTGKFACYQSFSDALAASKRTSEDVEHVDATFSYAIDSDAIRLGHAKSSPEWFARVLRYNITDNPPAWRSVATQVIKPAEKGHNRTGDSVHENR